METEPTHHLVFRIHQLSFSHHLFADVESLLHEATNTPTGAIQEGIQWGVLLRGKGLRALN